MGAAFASGARTSMVVNNSHASTNPLAGIRRTHVCERLLEEALEESPNQLRGEQPVLLEVMGWGIRDTLH